MPQLEKSLCAATRIWCSQKTKVEKKKKEFIKPNPLSFVFFFFTVCTVCANDKEKTVLTTEVCCEDGIELQTCLTYRENVKTIIYYRG